MLFEKLLDFSNGLLGKHEELAVQQHIIMSPETLYGHCTCQTSMSCDARECS